FSFHQQADVEGRGRACADLVPRARPLFGYSLRDPDEGVVVLGVVGEQLVGGGHEDQIAGGGQPLEVPQQLLEGIPVPTAARGELEGTRELGEEPALAPSAAPIDRPYGEP